MDNRFSKLVMLFFIMAASFSLQAQIPESRVMDWSKAGVTGGIPTGGEEINATDHGIVADGKTDNTAAINALINSTVSLNKVIKFPAGTIRCEGKLEFPVSGHRIIRGTLSGTGEKLTKFIFNTGSIGGNTGNFNVESGKDIGNEIVVSGGYTKGSKQLTLATTEGINAGDYIELRQDNDMSIMDSYHNVNIDDVWYARTIGQLVKVTAVNTSSKVITLSRSLRFTYKANFNPKIQKLQVTEKVGFEDFYTENLKTGNKCNFYFERAANCWIKNVHSFKTVTAHVNILQSLNLTVRESFFDHSWEHGDGGKGYGVVAASRTVDCLIENNEFTRLRHAMMTKQGSNGNVFGYNYSHDHINIYKATNPTVDISIHGHYSYMNLFEGNSVEWIHSADWWGPTGPGTTFFRNKVVWWDIYLDDNSQEQNVVGNELSNAEKRIRVHSSVKNTFLHGNVEGGSVSWDANSGTDNIRESYYLNSRPSFLKNDDPWPLYGPKPLTGDEGLITWEVWKAVSGESLADVPFSESPSETKQMLNFEGPVNDGDSYGSRLSGLLIPPASGKYVFYIAADDKGEVWLSTDENPANKKKIAEVTAYTSSRQWDKYESQQSAEISLEEGKRYYIEAIQKEGAGGDNLAVGWRLSDGTYERPLPATRFAPASDEPANAFPVITLKATESVTLPTSTTTLSGSATDADGTIASYQWTKVSGAAITMEGSATASLVLKDLAEGTYKFKLTVTDNLGATASKETTLQVLPAPNKLPVVSISSPADKAVAESNIAVEITATANDEDGSVSRVEFYVAGGKIGEDTEAPFSFSWTPEKAGEYVLTVKATDNSGAAVTSAAITMTIEGNENLVPVINLKEKEEITLPENEMTLIASAADEDGTIDSYEWTKVSGPPAEMNGNATASLALSGLEEGEYVFRLTVMDDRGGVNQGEIKVIVYPVPNKMPAVSLTSPVLNAVYSLGEEVEIVAEASDQDGSVSVVEFFQGDKKLGEDTSAPYSYTWTPAVTGGFTLLAKVTDDKGAIVFSNIGFVRIEEAPEPENVAPVISLKETETITLPLATLTLTATATDADGSVVSYSWTKVSGGSVSMSGISTASLKLEKLLEGNYEFMITVADDAGANSSKNVRVEVLADPNILPLVSISSPLANAAFESGSVVDISATASDQDGTISKVVFFAGFIKIGEVTAAPYILSWTPTTTGTYSVTAKAYDNAGASALSEAVIINIREPAGEPAPPVEETPEEERPEEPLTEYEGEGSITREFWDEVQGSYVSDIPTEETPTETSLLKSLEGPVNAGQNYGSRIRGYVHPPLSGEYTFWISGDDKAELYLSSDESPDNKELIAQASGNKIMRQWNKAEAQQSVSISLTGGKRYYIEVLHKEANGGDHVAVGWQLADGTYERPIPGNRLSPYVSQNILAIKPETAQQESISLYPNPAEDKLYLVIENAAAGEAQWNILDMQGKVYNQEPGRLNFGNSGAQEVDISGLNLSAGLYMIKVKSQTGYQMVKFMKK